MSNIGLFLDFEEVCDIPRSGGSIDPLEDSTVRHITLESQLALSNKLKVRTYIVVNVRSPTRGNLDSRETVLFDCSHQWPMFINLGL